MGEEGDERKWNSKVYKRGRKKSEDNFRNYRKEIYSSKEELRRKKREKKKLSMLIKEERDD